MSIYHKILIFAEQRDGVVPSVVFELIQGAAGLIRQTAEYKDTAVTAVIAGCQAKHTARQLVKSGADRVITIDHPSFDIYQAGPYTSAVTEVIESLKPDIVLFGSTSIGMELAPRVAARLNTSLVTDCTCLNLDPDSGLLLMTRPNPDGVSADTFICETARPQMATVRPGVMNRHYRDHFSGSKALKKGSIQSFDRKKNAENDGIQLIGTEKRGLTMPDITKAAILVSGGRGVKGPEGFQSLKTIASLLGGVIACSRACVDAGWMDPAYQVGQTGKTVHPDLYLACGISGAFQHMAGMSESKLIIAINQNPAAPIFQIADLGLVGKLEDILPELIKALENYKKTFRPYSPNPIDKKNTKC